VAFDKAREVKASKKAYRDALRDARTAMIKLAAQLMEKATDGMEWTTDNETGLKHLVIPTSAVQAMEVVRKACADEFESDKAKPRKNKPGQPRMSLEESRKILEDE
jgi:hypothetical protein